MAGQTARGAETVQVLWQTSTRSFSTGLAWHSRADGPARPTRLPTPGAQVERVVRTRHRA
jgi:hypothetical protein